MLFKFTVKSKNTALKNLQVLCNKLQNRAPLMMRIGKCFEKTLRRHFLELNKRPNKRGWRRLGFWSDIAKSTSFVGASTHAATVAIQNGKSFGAKVFGGKIKPTGGRKFLAIPAIEARYGVSPSSLDKNELIFRRTRKGGILGNVRSDGTMQVHYWLVRSANVPRDPQALPKDSEILNSIKSQISTYIKK